MAYGTVSADVIQSSETGISLGAGNATRFKNRFINPQFQIAQRGTSGTSGSGVPTTTATYPSVDRWFAYGTGATVTVAQVAGSGNVKNYLQLTGAASVTGAGIGQRIEAVNSYDLAGRTATLSAYISNSLLTTVTWTAYYAGSTDVWTSSTQIATGTFTVTSSVTQYSAQISIPSAATTGIQVIFSVGAQTSGTFVLSNPQLEVGSSATGFDYRDYGTELVMCQRYYFGTTTFCLGVTLNANDGYASTLIFPVVMRTTPTLQSGGSYSVLAGSAGTPANRPAFTNNSSMNMYNSAANWTSNTILSFTGGVSAEL
jgi:hypothetical protein